MRIAPLDGMAVVSVKTAAFYWGHLSYIYPESDESLHILGKE